MEREKNWHYLTERELSEALYSDSASGLTEAEAMRRVRKRRNRIWLIRSETVAKYAARSLLDPSAVLLALSVIAAAVYGEGAVAAAVLILTLCGKTAEIFSFTIADREFRRSAKGAVPRARVVRGGTVEEIPAELVAEGDLIVLDAGDTVPCDIRLTAADSVLVAETTPGAGQGLYIKNAEPMRRGDNEIIPELRTNMLYAASSVVYGFCMGFAVATGKKTLTVMRDGMIELTGTKNIPVLEKLSDWSRLCRLFLVGAAFIITVLGTLFSHSLLGAFLPSVAMASACMSEYLAAFGSLSVALSLENSYIKEDGVKEKTVFRNASQIEAAARTRVLVMRSPELLKSGKKALHSFYINDKALKPEDDGEINAGRLPAFACYSAGAEKSSFLPLQYLKKLKEKYGGEATEYVIAEHRAAGEAETCGLDCSLVCRNGEYLFITSGSPEGILPMCSKQYSDGEVIPLTKDKKELAASYARQLEESGVNVLAVASRMSVYNSLRRLPVLQNELCLEGFIAVAEKTERDVCEYINSFRGEGGSLVIFSEDERGNVPYLKAAGIFRLGDIFLTQNETAVTSALQTDKGALIVAACPKGAAGAEIRQRLVAGLSAKTKVTYIGYGAEDAVCMQSATVSFATGTAIPQALRSIAGGVTESAGGGFGSSWRMLCRFRRTLADISATVKFLIASQVARLLLLLICSVLPLPLPYATEIVFFGIIFDFCAALCAVRGKKSTYNGTTEYTEKTHPVPEKPIEVLIPAVAGTVAAALSIAAPFAGRAVLNASGFEYNFTAPGLSACIFCGLLLSLILIYGDYTFSNGLFGRGTKAHRLFFVPVLISALAVALIFLAPQVGYAMNMEFPGWIALAFSLVPAIGCMIFLAVCRAYRKTKNQ